VRALDPTRLVTAASGWTDTGAGDLHDIHVYPGPAAPEIGARRASVLGEFGGLGLAIDGHRWQAESWGYQGVADSEALTRGYEELLGQVWDLVDGQGLCAAVYTQTSDVETECNGLVTYDREVVKVDVHALARASRGEFPAASHARARRAQRRGRVEVQPRAARRRLDAPGLRRLALAARPGRVRHAGHAGSARAHGMEWQRHLAAARVRALDLPRRRPVPGRAPRRGLRDLLNGSAEPIRLSGYTTGYQRVAVPKGLLRPGTNRIAVHCHQTVGGQYFDAGVLCLSAGRR
jgi:hypothetical protein